MYCGSCWANAALAAAEDAILIAYPEVQQSGIHACMRLHGH